jgi:hypothetical protein
MNNPMENNRDGNNYQPLNNQVNSQIGHTNNKITAADESLFRSSPTDLYNFRKIEKICGAVHYITNFINENEPLRQSLRIKSIKMVESFLSFMNNNDRNKSILLSSVFLVEIRSLLQTGLYTNLISEMNYGILKDEIDSLINTLETKRQQSFTLPFGFMHVLPSEPPDYSMGQNKGQNFYKNSPLETRYNPNTQEPTVSQNSYQNLNKNLSNNQYAVSNRQNIIKPAYPPKTPLGNSDRTIKILSLLKDKKELTIKDFSNSIKGCSEKTLQRELLKLVAEGKIIKRGERRWSRYSLE